MSADVTQRTHAFTLHNRPRISTRRIELLPDDPDFQAHCAQALIDAGARLKFQDADTGETALMRCCALGREKLLHLLIDTKLCTKSVLRITNGAGKDALCIACEVGWQGAVRRLLDCGAQVDDRTLRCALRNRFLLLDLVRSYWQALDPSLTLTLTLTPR